LGTKPAVMVLQATPGLPTLAVTNSPVYSAVAFGPALTPVRLAIRSIVLMY
jgi:hypothetical protein